MEPVLGRTQVGELRDVAVRDIRSYPLGYGAGCAVWREGIVNQRNGQTGDRPDFGGDDVVEYPPTVRKAGDVASEHAEQVRTRGRRNRQVQSHQVGLRGAAEVAGDTLGHAIGNAREQNRLQVEAFLRVGRKVGKDTCVQDWQQRGKLRMLDVLGKTLVVLRLRGVPAILVAHRHDDFVEQRIGQARDLDPRTRTNIVVV